MSTPLIILVTGANQGIGYSTSIILARTGKYHVLLGSRDLSKGEAAAARIQQDPSVAPGSVSALQLDLASDTSIQQAAATVQQRFGHLDILLNNAAIATPPPDVPLRVQYAAVLDTNVAGQAAVTEAFLPLLRASRAAAPARRIVFVSSGGGSLTRQSTAAPNPMFAPYGIYRVSKAALNMLALLYMSDLREEGIAVTLCTPGFCATNLNEYSESALYTPEEGARALVHAAVEGTNEEVMGRFSSNDGIVSW